MILTTAFLLLVPQDRTSWTFTDVTDKSGVTFRYTFGDDEFSSILEDTGSGVALIDFDHDGLIDVYFVNGSYLDGVSDPAKRSNLGAQDRLYKNLGGMRFQDVTDAAGVGEKGYGMGAVVGDYDNDGDEDLYVLNYGPNVLFRNNGNGTFTDVTKEAGVAGPAKLSGFRKWSVNGVFFDYDRDGDLDLYVANYLAFDPRLKDLDLPPEFPYPGPDAYQGQASQLYRNDDGQFVDVTEQTGLLREDSKTMGTSVSDFDGDGFLDIFEAADGVPNLLFHAKSDGTFVEIGTEAGVAYDELGGLMASMHSTIGDFDGDGKQDIFVPNLAHGCLYRNLGQLNFQECSGAVGLAGPLKRRGAWGSHFEDFDNDADLDLVVVLGGAFSLSAGESDKLFQNDGKGRFSEVSATLGPCFQEKSVSRGAAFGDLDNDGDVDYVVNRKDKGGAPRIVRNDLASKNHWLTLKLIGSKSNRDGVGARVLCKTKELSQLREVQRSNSYLSQNDVRVHYGLGALDAVESLTIHWPSGQVQKVEVKALDRLETIQEPSH